MDYTEKLEKVIRDNEGQVLTKYVVAKKNPKIFLTIFAKKGKLERIAQ